MRVIAWSEARRQGLVRYFTGIPCKYGHVAERFVGNSECVECANARYRSGGRERERVPVSPLRVMKWRPAVPVSPFRSAPTPA